jgi:protein phosphatase
MLSHQGRVRTNNEDVVCYALPRADDAAAARGSLALVADGMGGEAAGEVASRLAADTMYESFYQLDGSVPEILAAGLDAANQAIYQLSQTNQEYAGMGTTCTAIAVRDSRLFLGHVGDSRAYMLRASRFHQLSVDHSLVAELVRDGVITAEEAANRPDRNIILQALGTRPAVEPLVWKEGMPLLPGDAVVLCSDGLTDLVDDTAIATVLADLPPFEACQALIDAALAAGGHDNVSVGVFTVADTMAPPATAQRDTREIQLTHETPLIRTPGDIS